MLSNDTSHVYNGSSKLKVIPSWKFGEITKTFIILNLHLFLQLLLDNRPVVSCKQYLPPTELRQVHIKEGSFELQDVDYFPKQKKGNPCCAACVVQ